MKILQLFLVLNLLLSCNNNDDANTLVYNLSLVQHDPSFDKPYTFTQNEVLWEFSKDGILSITTKEGVEISENSFFEKNGTYQYQKTFDDMIIIDTNPYYFNSKNDTIIIESTVGVEADGERFTLLKN